MFLAKHGLILVLRELDLNQRPSGYEPDELPSCSIPRSLSLHATTNQGISLRLIADDFIIIPHHFEFVNTKFEFFIISSIC